MSSDPFHRLLELWQAARAACREDADRVALATADARGRPSVRYVLLREHTETGLVFFTNYGSRKSVELEANPHAALALHWWETGVQLRVEGPVRRAAPELSDAYFAKRARGSQIGAWASEQSRPLPSPELLSDRTKALESKFEGQPVPRPEGWGGYELTPDLIELWFNRDNRLHEREQFTRTGGQWVRVPLQP